MDDYTLFLKKEFSFVPYAENFDLARRSTIGAGGTAKLAFFPDSVESLIRLVDGLKNCGVKFAVLGNLSNVLPADGSSEVVYILTQNVKGVETGNKFFAYAGTSSTAFLRVCEEAGKSGGEFLAGIPCTIGGAAFMNAGVSGSYLSEIVESVLYYLDGEVRSLPVAECGYSYKNSRFMRENGVILGVTFRLVDSDKENILKARGYYLEKRKHLPKGKSMGCVFKNPENLIAGQLIENAGLKKMRVGGAVVSSEHANFIINENRASSKEIKSLIALIKNAVYTQYKVRLEEEIRYLD
ncbi:MAG: UDP-N-acetylmuramate dehydrogenase [Clostridia bacterium]|nr:UDP-N-acetylmuramate dehydrogenase [Clostridia bacterium]